MNTTIRPSDGSDHAGTGIVTLNLSTAEFNGIVGNHLDTLHSDYAFIISSYQLELAKEATQAEEPEAEANWDFALYPNPARDELYLRLPDDSPKEVILQDLLGRRIQAWTNVTGPLQHLSLGQLAMGAYSVRVSDGANSKTKKLIIH